MRLNLSRQLHSKFDSLTFLTLLELSNLTGCLAPCTYMEYRVLKNSRVSCYFEKIDTNLLTFKLTRNGTQLIIQNISPYLLVETEDLVYNVESLIAEFGGTLLVTFYCNFFVRWDSGTVPGILFHKSLGWSRDYR